MGFKNFINSKKIVALGAALLLGGNNLLMAQDAAADPAYEAAKAHMWSNVSYYVLLFILLSVVLAIIGRILKVYDLTSQLQGKKGTNWNTIMAVFFGLFLIIGGCAAYWSITVQGGMILPEAASLHGVKIDYMFWTTTVLTMIVFVITQILLFVFLFVYRYSTKRKAYFLPHNNTIEKVWTIIPAIVLTILVVFGFTTWRTVTNTAQVKGDLNIDITGHQFAWEIRYPGKDDKLGAKNFTLVTATNSLGIDYKDRNSFDDLRADTIVLPVNKSIRVNIFAQDVIHSVYMPYFRVQMNAVPGLPTFFKFVPTITTKDMRDKLNDQTFEYLLYCNKICGGGHYNMKRIVRVVSEAEYQQWIAQQKPYLSDGLKQELKLADAGQQKSEVNRLALNN